MTHARYKPFVALESGQVLSLDDARGLRIRAKAGTLWVTEEGNLDDHVVDTGDSLVIAHDGRTVIQAMSHSWIAIDGLAANDPTQTAA